MSVVFCLLSLVFEEALVWYNNIRISLPRASSIFVSCRLVPETSLIFTVVLSLVRFVRHSTKTCLSGGCLSHHTQLSLLQKPLSTHISQNSCSISLTPNKGPSEVPPANIIEAPWFLSTSRHITDFSFITYWMLICYRIFNVFFLLTEVQNLIWAQGVLFLRVLLLFIPEGGALETKQGYILFSKNIKYWKITSRCPRATHLRWKIL